MTFEQGAHMRYSIDLAQVAAFFLAAYAAVSGSFTALAVAVVLLTFKLKLHLGGRA